MSGELPAELTTFIGRRRQLSEIRRVLGSARLVTLTGVGGVGKTRLALRSAQGLGRSFTDGVRFVDLAVLADPQLVVAATCQSLTLRDQSRWTSASLGGYLKDRRLLLVLDNCEHLLDACAELAESLLRAAPELRIICTSRQALGLIGEAVVRVPPLTLPCDGANVRVQMAEEFEALELFVQRASTGAPDFQLNDSNVALVAETCRRLDGIPLAIEFVTARLRSMGLEQIVAGLDDSYRLLSGSTRTVVTRQQTLRALIAWSFDLCSVEEQTLWCRLSVFSGSFDLDAARFVCSDAGLPDEIVAETIAGLVEKSVLFSDPHKGMRYRLLETVRAYGAERLHVVTEASELRRRHRDYYRTLIATAQSQWLDHGQITWLNRLREEYANIRTALGYCLDVPHNADICLDMAARLWAFWIADGALGEGRQWLERGLRESGTKRTSARGRALWVASYIAACQGDLDAGEKWLHEGQSIATAGDDAVTLAYLASAEGLIVMLRGDPDRANILLAAATEEHRRLGEVVGIMDAQFLLGTLASVAGGIEGALELAHGTLEMCEQFGEQWWRAWAQRNLAVALWRGGERARSGEVVIQALRTCRDLNEQMCGALCLEICAWKAAADNDHYRAAVLFGAMTSIWDDLSTPPFWQLPDEDARWKREIQGVLSASSFDAAFGKGLQMSFGQALTYSLREQTPSSGTDAISNGNGKNTAILTHRELEVVDCVCEGLNNQEVASRLVISKRTAETHVAHIFNKLGLSNRTQIAAWASSNRPAKDWSQAFCSLDQSPREADGVEVAGSVTARYL